MLCVITVHGLSRNRFDKRSTLIIVIKYLAIYLKRFAVKKNAFDFSNKNDLKIRGK